MRMGGWLRSLGSVAAMLRTALSGERLGRFLNALDKPDLHVAARLTLKGPEATGGMYSPRIFAKGSAWLRIRGG